jgi:hypothetical protein
VRYANLAYPAGILLGINPDNNRSYRTLLLSLFGLLVFLNMTDLLSTSVALSVGLSEGNAALVSFSQDLGTSVVVAALLSKLVFIASAGLVCVLGIKTPNRKVRTRIAVLLVILVAMLAIVSVNNFYLIGTV